MCYGNEVRFKNWDVYIVTPAYRVLNIFYRINKNVFLIYKHSFISFKIVIFHNL